MRVLGEIWPYLLAAVIPIIQIGSAVHVILRKRDVRSAVGWTGLIWLAPLIGAGLYWLIGVNRIQRKARSLRPERPDYGQWIPDVPVGEDGIREVLSAGYSHLNRLVPLGDRVSGRPLLSGNRVDPLIDGDRAYPEMLAAIEGATSSVTLLSYIFDSGDVGDRFAQALTDAVGRGVDVRVLIDDVGARYSTPRMASKLRRAGVRVAHFMPGWFPWRAPFVNLRNHRKILVVDGRTAFTGGLNIRDEFWRGVDPDHFARDLHFRLEGPVVLEIQEIFAEDWTFTTGERLEGERWFAPPRTAGRVLARGISDGPDVDYEKLETILLGALGIARSSVRILTPYFLPDPALLSALNVAALRGVEVEVLVPAKGNLALVEWASAAQMDQMIEKGVRIYASPPPFDHSKLMVVDGCWTLLGSANWDPRSLELNFEFNVECYDIELGTEMERLFTERREASTQVTLDDLKARSLPVRIRDGIARLFSPYL